MHVVGLGSSFVSDNPAYRNVLPSFMQWHPVAAMFNGIRPAVVALIAAPTFRMAKSARIGWGNAWIPVVSALLIWALHVNPIWIIVAAGVGGFVYGRIFKEGQS